MRRNPFDKFLTFEDNEHIMVVNYVRGELPDIIAVHTPNEGKRSAFEQFKVSKMGIVAGFPDFAFFYPKYDNSTPKQLIYHGLLIELKAPEHNRIIKKGKNAGKIVKTKGELSKEQEMVLAKLNKEGYMAVCCWGYEEAIKIIKEYFKDYLAKLKEVSRNRFKTITKIN